MAFVEMGPVTNTLMRMVTKNVKANKVAPLFTRDTPRNAFAGVKAPIETAPLNATEAQERDTLRGLRDAIHADKRA